MTGSSSAAAQFASPLTLAEPFEDAIQLRKRTPSPSMMNGHARPLSIAHVSANLSTRELQALVRSQSGMPDHRASMAFELGDSPRMDLLPPNHPYAYERPLEMARRFSSSVDLLPIASPPVRSHAPEKDTVFGLDIRDPWGLSFRSETPYDALRDATSESPSLTPAAALSPGSFHYRRGSTPSLTSSPAASSATTSTASSMLSNPASQGSVPDLSGFTRRRVSSLSDLPINRPPPPQPIPLGKSRMADELQYEEPLPKREHRKSTAFSWFRSSSSSSVGKASSDAQAGSRTVRACMPPPPGLQSAAPKPTRATTSPYGIPKSQSAPPLPSSAPMTAPPSRSRSSLSIPKLLSKHTAPDATSRQRPSQGPSGPSPPQVNKSSHSNGMASPAMSTRSSFFGTFGRTKARSPPAPKGPRSIAPPGLTPPTPPLGPPVPASRALRDSGSSTSTVTRSTTPIAAAFTSTPHYAPPAAAAPNGQSPQRARSSTHGPPSVQRAPSMVDRRGVEQYQAMRATSPARPTSVSPPPSAGLAPPATTAEDHRPPRPVSRNSNAGHRQSLDNARRTSRDSFKSMGVRGRPSHESLKRAPSSSHSHTTVRSAALENGPIPAEVVLATARGIRLSDVDSGEAPPLPPPKA